MCVGEMLFSQDLENPRGPPCEVVLDSREASAEAESWKQDATGCDFLEGFLKELKQSSRRHNFCVLDSRPGLGFCERQFGFLGSLGSILWESPIVQILVLTVDAAS